MPSTTRRRKEKQAAGAGLSAPGRTVRRAASDAPSAMGDSPVLDCLVVRGAAQNNLKSVDVAFPLGRFICVTGVSGSGKSSLVNDILHEALAAELNGALTTPGKFERMEVLFGDGDARGAIRSTAGEKHRAGNRTAGGGDRASSRTPMRPRAEGRIAKGRMNVVGPSVRAALDKVIAIDQTPIGRTPRSNPATYIKVFDEIRTLYTKLPDAKLRGYKPGRFSFNVESGRKGGGRCEACQGNGANCIEMDFLADVWVTCPVCAGRRFSRETLQIHFKEKSIADVLDMDVQDAMQLFENQGRIGGMLRTLHDVGLDYIKLGQSSTTLSGGEAQRIKLARELVKKPTGRTLYILDEPTTGLHFEDIRKLLAVLHGFVDAGNTVVVIEHNLDVLKTADWIIDLGPEGGDAGGRIVAEGTPEDVASIEGSYTGAALREVLSRSSSECRVKNNELKNMPARRAEIDTVVDERDARDAELDNLDSEFAVRRADQITVRGARQHNLKDITVSFPRDRTTVCTGLSGSGKTSFAIDTVYTEGHRRYVESLSAYARQFLGQMAKPRVEHVEGLSPAICIEQKSAGKSPRSTVGTVTEIYDYMRVLWARVGTPHCPTCETPIGSQTADEIIDRVMGLGAGTPIMVLAPVALGEGESWASMFNRLKASGYVRVRIDGVVQETAQAGTIDARRKHRVEVVVDRAVVQPRSRGRVAESVEHGLSLGNGVVTVLQEEVETVETDDAGAAIGTHRRPAREQTFSQRFACAKCGRSFVELSPHHFSFNSQLGWCETCEGLGVQRGAPASEIIKQPGRSILSGAVAGWESIPRPSPMGRMVAALCVHLGLEVETPLSAWPESAMRTLMFGSREWISVGAADAADRNAGLRPVRVRAGNSKSSDAETKPATWLGDVRFQWKGFFPAIDDATRNSWVLRYKLQNVVSEIPCITCRGGRLRPDAAAVRLCGRTVVEVCLLPLSAAAEFFENLKLEAREKRVAGELLKEIRDRLAFLINVGLDYVSLHRSAPTLSGGEAQRIRLASQIGTGLSGVLYVLDEPTIGLHPRDTGRLIRALAHLRDLGNTLLLVEHDRDVIRSADRILDFGPGAGRHGGRIVAEGPPEGMMNSELRTKDEERGSEEAGRSLTQEYLSGRAAIPVPTNRRTLRVPEGLLRSRGAAVSTDGFATGRGADATQSAVEAGDVRRPEAVSRTVVVEPDYSQMPAEEMQGVERKSGQSAGGQRVKESLEPTDEGKWLVIRGARHNNLKNIDVAFPLSRFTCVTGVSGSGKSSLVNDILWPVLASRLNRNTLSPGQHDGVEVVGAGTKPESAAQARGKSAAASLRPNAPKGKRAGSDRAAERELEHAIDRVINVDQSPIGTTPTSNPATYCGAFDWIRELFARLPDAKVRGYTNQRFSFNRPGGRCEPCEGNGQKRIEMHFLPDVWVECETCRGRRYNPETLEIRYKGRSIADVLEMSVSEALDVFANVPKVRRMLQTLADVGLDYLQLGQPAPTLSGGEAQRVKLAAELGKPNTGKTFYILDEPTTGLHFDDVRRLLDVLQRLVDLGNTVVVVEHNLDVLKSADLIIDLGPEAGDGGGRIVAMGTPEEVVASNELRVTSSKGGRTTERVNAMSVRQLVTLNSLLDTSDIAAVSHTATALAPVIRAGPYAARTVYDAKAHAARELEVERSRLRPDVEAAEGARMPWQVDGRKWHLSQRESRNAKPRRWQPEALEFVEKLVQEAGEFAATDWNDRARVEIKAAGAEKWFLHALTGGEWLIEMYFLAPQGAFEEAKLQRQIGLKTLNEREDIQAYGDRARVEVRRRVNNVDAIAVYVHDKEEIDTAGFRKFIKDSSHLYLRSLSNAK